MAARCTDAARVSRRSLLIGCATVGVPWLLHRDANGNSPQNAIGLQASELNRANVRAARCSAANAAGVGLQGRYFAAEAWHGAPALVRIDEVIDFDDTLDWPPGIGPARPRSVRWTGWIKPPLSGRYRFHGGVPEARVSVSRQVMTGPGVQADSIQLAAGRYYPIAVELARIAGGAKRIRLEWTAPHGSRFLVPRALLYLPSDAIAPAKPV